MRQQASTRCGTKGSDPTEPSRTTREIVGSSCVTAAPMQSSESVCASSISSIATRSEGIRL